MYLEKNKPELFVGYLYGFDLMAAALRKTAEDGRTGYYQVAYTLRAPVDSFNFNVALGNLGLRLETGDHEYAFRVHLPENGVIVPKRMARVIEAHFEMDLAAGKRRPAMMMQHFKHRWRCHNYVVATSLEELQELDAVVRKYPHAVQYKVRRSLHLGK